MRFLTPALGLLLIGFAFPLLYIVFMSVDGAEVSIAAYQELVTKTLYMRVLWNTLEISALSTVATLLIGYPIAYHLASLSPRGRAMVLILVLLPFWTSILVKSFSFTILLGENGLVNQFVRSIFGAQAALPLLFNRTGVIIGMTHFLVPFMVFSILSSLTSQGPEYRRAAEIMGASKLRIFWKIVFPLSLPGVISGSLMCLILSMGMYITPALLGGRGDLMISNLIDFHIRETLNWTAAAALSVVLLAVTGALAFGLARAKGGQLFGDPS